MIVFFQRSTYPFYALALVFLVVLGLGINQLELDLPVLRLPTLRAPVGLGAGAGPRCPEPPLDAVRRKLQPSKGYETEGFSGTMTEGKGFDWVGTRTMFVL